MRKHWVRLSKSTNVEIMVETRTLPNKNKTKCLVL